MRCLTTFGAALQLFVFLTLCSAAEPTSNRPTLFIIGDSTVKNSTPGQQGWGEKMAGFFDPSRIKLANHAIGGRSSRTFQSEGRWQKVLDELKPGDFVLMQFGHNDGGPINDNSRARGSLRGTSDDSQQIENLLTKKPEVVHSYGWYMRKYINDTKAKGATPIVLSPVPRKIWKDDKIVRATNDYGRWAAESAASGGAVFVDLNDIIARRYEALGPESVNKLFGDDHTHTNPSGAELNAACVLAGLQQLPGAPFSKFLSAEGLAASRASDSVTRPSK